MNDKPDRKGGKYTRPSLSGRDRQLWDEVAKTITPLDERGDTPEIPPRKMISRIDRDRDLSGDWYSQNAPDPRRNIDRKTKRRIASGHQDVDRSIDLHGLNQDQAYGVLKNAIEGAIRRGEKTLLVVTGKGGARFQQLGAETPTAYRTRADFDQYGGTLRRMVPVWLNMPDLKPFVESYSPAAKEHGGEGAMYILLRRRLPGSRKGQQR